jgi:hypothetical protein
MLIIQASHVGYDPKNKVFGTYRRAHLTADMFYFRRDIP